MVIIILFDAQSASLATESPCKLHSISFPQDPVVLIAYLLSGTRCPRFILSISGPAPVSVISPRSPVSFQL